MRTIFFLLFLGTIILFSGCNNSQNGPEEISPPPSATEEWDLVWSDEFDYTGLPDPKKWSYDVGFIRNNEDQYYTKARSENIFVKDGILTITGRKEEYPNAKYKPGSDNWREKKEFASYTSACIHTQSTFTFTYGKVEVRARLPKGNGVWPAIWTLGSNIYEVDWPTSGEIDIMEHIGGEPNTIHTNIHYARPSDGGHAQQSRKRDILSIYDDFQIYSMEWDEEKIVIFVNGIALNTFDAKLAGDIYKRSQYLLLNLALGGNWGGEIDDSIFPAHYEIDYVRIYKKK